MFFRWNTSTCTQDYTIINTNMLTDTDVGRKNHMIATDGAARDPCKRTKNIMFAQFNGVRYLNQVINFGALTDNGGA